MKAASFETMGDKKMANKYRCESGEASQKLQDLRERIEASKDKTLAVHMDYSSPEEGAKLMFESFWKHLNKLLETGEAEISSRLQELIDHDAFMASRQALYIGGEKYFDVLDDILKTDTTGKVLVTGEAGQGKTALLANWVSHVRETQPETLIVYHFIGASKNSGTRKNILKRLITELDEALPPEELTKDDEDVKDSNKDNPEQNNKEEKNETKNTDQSENKTTLDDETKKEDKEICVNTEKTNKSTDGEKTDDEKDEKNVENENQEKGNEDGKEEKKEQGKEEKKEQRNKEKIEGKEEKKQEKDGKKKQKATSKEVKDLLKDLQAELERSEKGDKRVVIIVDGLDKLVSVGKIIKPVSWLPDTIPQNVKIVVSTKNDDTTSIEELVGVRHYQTLPLEDLEVKHRTEICVKLLEKSGKALSPDQLEKVVHKDQTKNPLFLKLVMAELAVFGSFRKLDEKIDYLLSSNSVGELCVKFLERLEVDYNTPDLPGIVQQVLQSIAMSQEGMSETELKDMLNIPTHVWSPLYFALEQFIVVHSNNISFSYAEISKAVHERYLKSEEERHAVIKTIVAFFDSQRKNFKVWPRPAVSILQRPASQLPWLQKKIMDVDGLTATLSDLNIFHSLIIDNEYELLELWKVTGHSFSWIADRYIKEFDQAMVYIYHLEKEQLFSLDEEKRPPGQRLMYHLENVRFFMDTASCGAGSTKVIQRIIQLLEHLEGVWHGSDRMEMLMEMRYYLACNMCDSEQYEQAVDNHQSVIKYWTDAMKAKECEESKAESRLAWAYNGLGLTHYHKKDFKEAEKLFRESLALHLKHGHIRHQADSWTNIGLVNLGNKDNDTAVKSFDKALKLYEDHFFDSVPHCIGNLYTNIGLAYRRKNDLNQAEKYYMKSLELKANAVGWDHPVIATAYMNLGTLETHRKNYTKVEEYTIKAIEIYKLNHWDHEGREYRMCRENLANCYLRQKEYDKAIPYYWSVFDVLKKLDLMHECLSWVHNTMAEHYLDTGDYDKADLILSTLGMCPQKRTAKTYLLLDKLDELHPRTDLPPRPEELTYEFGLKLYPYNSDMVRHKVIDHYIARGDMDGFEKYYDSIEAESLDYIQAANWCKEENKPGFASEVIKLCLRKFPDIETLKGYAAEHWFEVKQYDKALELVDQMKVEDEYDEVADLACATVLHHFGREEEARRWLKKVFKKSPSKDVKTKAEELKEKLGGDAAFTT